MAQIASGVKIREGYNEKVIKIQKRYFPFFVDKEEGTAEVMIINISEDWRSLIRKYLSNPNEKVERSVKYRSMG